jgi:hypothetical protein
VFPTPLDAAGGDRAIVGRIQLLASDGLAPFSHPTTSDRCRARAVTIADTYPR